MGANAGLTPAVVTVDVAAGGTLVSGARFAEIQATIGSYLADGTVRVASGTTDVSTRTYTGNMFLGRSTIGGTLGTIAGGNGKGTLSVAPGGLVSVSGLLFVPAPTATVVAAPTGGTLSLTAAGSRTGR